MSKEGELVLNEGIKGRNKAQKDYCTASINTRTGIKRLQKEGIEFKLFVDDKNLIKMSSKSMLFL